ncbi:MAG: hypothetical protein WC600_03285 [Desulfobaccales bacterium]
MSPGIEAVRTLAKIGYRFTVNGEKIKAKYHGPGEPDPDTVRPLLETVKEHKPDVLEYLSRPTPPERILTCFECDHFRPAVSSPNPTQAFGRCEKRKKGRYGCATACEAALEAKS